MTDAADRFISNLLNKIDTCMGAIILAEVSDFSNFEYADKILSCLCFLSFDVAARMMDILGTGTAEVPLYPETLVCKADPSNNHSIRHFTLSKNDHPLCFESFFIVGMLLKKGLL